MSTDMSKRRRRGSKYTLGSYFAELLGFRIRKRGAPTWPPDVFAIAAGALQVSGAYRRVLESWPPTIPGTGTSDAWVKRIRELGLGWRRGWHSPTAAVVPPEIHEWWEIAEQARDTPLTEIGNDPNLCDALLQLLAVSDEASIGFGIPGSDLSGTAGFGRDLAYRHAQELLVRSPGEFGASLAERIHPSRVRVLPKLHTPQTGLTIRSMSHHLAFCLPNEVRPHWSVVPRLGRRTELNLLLVPWPDSIRQDQFQAVPGSKVPLINLPSRYGFFTFRIDPKAPFRIWLDRLLRATTKRVGTIDGIVLPELSIAETQWRYVRRKAAQMSAFLVAGLGKPAARVGAPGKNCVNVDIPLSAGYIVHLPTQVKHHRWQLEKYQIERYGLERILAPDRLWWEYSSIDQRTLNFVPLYDWLTMAVLICEDLARPDPVGELVRAVGPNLVISLLMDGAQRTDRWSSRYAAVLADDPGCSVLTLTSLGMTQLGPVSASGSKARSIALWKDARNGPPKVIELEAGADAIVLRVGMEDREEWTADGRSDEGTTCYPVLREVVQIPAPPRSSAPGVRRVGIGKGTR